VDYQRIVKYSAVSFILIWISRYIPLFGVFLLFLSVAPFVLLYRYGGLKEMLFGWLLLKLLLVLSAGYSFALIYAAVYFPYSAGVCFFAGRKRFNTVTSVLYSSSVWISLVFVISLGYKVMGNINLLEQTIRQLKISAAFSMGRFYDVFLPSRQIDALNGYMLKVIDVFTAGAGGLIILSGIVGTVLLYAVLSRYGRDMVPSVIFKKFRMPENLIWFLITAAVLYWAGGAGRASANGIVFLISVNMAVLLLAGYLAGGAALLVSFMIKFNMPLFLRVLFMIFLFFVSGGIYVFIGLGIADTWLNMRKRFSL